MADCSVDVPYRDSDQGGPSQDMNVAASSEPADESSRARDEKTLAQDDSSPAPFEMKSRLAGEREHTAPAIIS